MKTNYVLVSIASLALLAACEQQADDSAMEAPDTAAAADSAGIVLPATTSSDVAREHYMAGWADFENARFNSANDKFLLAAAEDPSFAMAHMMAALSSASTESFVSNLRQASAHKAEATAGEQLIVVAFERALESDAEGQIAALVELTTVHPDSPRALLLLGNAYANVNNSADARAAYARAIELEPGLVPAHINLGNNFLTQEPKDFDKAEAHFNHAVAITPNEPNPHDFLGDVHRAQNNLEAAYYDYSKAAELAPDLGAGYQQRGHVNSFLGNYDEARADYTRSAELEDARGTNVGGFFLIFRANVSVYEGNPEAAIAELRQLADGADEAYSEGAMDLKVVALSNAALFATEAGDSDTASAAIADAAVVLRQQADDVGSDALRDAQEATISYMEGLLAARTGDAETAAAEAAEFEGFAASSSNPRRLERMHEILGLSAYFQGDYASAVEHLSAGDHLNNMYTKYYLARANEEAGNADEAARLYAELAVWNFNGPGYAMFREDILDRAK
jgi:cytochrome c-type biogenesis protein CcmH/NrfG